MVGLQRLLAPVLLASTALAGVLDPGRPDSKVARNVLEGKSEGYCSPSGPIESTNCAFETVEALNKDLFPAIHELVTHPFFRYYKVDLYRECPFWSDNGGFCMNRACAVEEADEADIPEKWRASSLGQVRTSTILDGVSGCYFRDDDFCFMEDDATLEGQYVDLIINPERFTGYAGDSAQQVWRAIYQENCFGLSEASLEAARGGKMLPGISRAQPPIGFSKLTEGWGTEMAKVGLAPEDMCEEKKLYYRVVSGLHASISIHICADYLDKSTGLWGPNLQCFINRLATHPERLSNVYFNAVLLMRAVARAAPYFRAYDIGMAPRIPGLCPPEIRDADNATRDAFESVLALAERTDVANGFDESEFFNRNDAPILKEEFKSHFRNVSRIMDCVGCDKCRLWGKLQVSGIGTALKILFALDKKDLDPKRNPNLLQRSEVVALFNVLHRVSESLNAVEDFRRIYATTQAEEAAAVASREAERQRELARKEAERRAKEWKNRLANITPQAVLAGVLSILEAVRRSCRGCVEVCVRAARELLEGGGAGGKAEL